MRFELESAYKPTGDQPKAIAQLVDGIRRGGEKSRQTLLGVTGSGKTYSMSNVIERVQKPTLVISPNKTLAAQLYAEFRGFFPKNHVGYFVSYFDYYQPESYLPAQDQYIPKDSRVNEKVEQLRLAATANLLSRKDVIIVATVSSIYGLGSPVDWLEMSLEFHQGQEIERQELLRRLIGIQYNRNDLGVKEGFFRAKGDTIDVFPPYAGHVLRFQLDGNRIGKIQELEPINLRMLTALKQVRIFPARHFVVPNTRIKGAVAGIRQELEERLTQLPELEANRLKQRTEYDLEMIEAMGYCNGIENYSRYFDGRLPGMPPSTLVDFFGDDFLLVIDESHVTIPQLHGMQKGDYSRKKNLVDYGFRLPSAYDNRPLNFDELEKKMRHAIFVSATPGDWELKTSQQVAEQLIRPTGLIDPSVEVRGTQGQADDLTNELKAVAAKGERAFVTTLTKRMAEDLTDYFVQRGVKARYLHSEIGTIERSELLRQLRLGQFDVLVGINLLREGLDVPEVALVAILDADKEGFLRTDRSLIQTFGRAARNSNGRVILYADHQTDAMKKAMGETNRRRAIQAEYNHEHGITPHTIVKAVSSLTPEDKLPGKGKAASEKSLRARIINLEAEMHRASETLEFERAIELRDELRKLREEALALATVRKKEKSRK